MFFAYHPTYLTYILSLFIIGIGFAVLQVAFWPLLRVAGGEENYSFNSVLTQLFFGGASFISLLVYSYFVINIPNADTNLLLKSLSHLVPQNLPWVSIYWLNAAVILFMIIAISFIKFPTIDLKEDEKLEGFKTVSKLLKDKVVIAFFFGIFAYVGLEQSVSIWISQFLSQYHGINPDTEGAHIISLFWLLQSLGAFLGIILLKIYDVKSVLKAFFVLQIIALALALFGNGEIALIAFPVVGFLTSVMYGGIFSLGMNSIKNHHGTVSGIFLYWNFRWGYCSYVSGSTW